MTNAFYFILTSNNMNATYKSVVVINNETFKPYIANKNSYLEKYMQRIDW